MSKITFKQWASNFFKGIWQAMVQPSAIAGIAYKNSRPDFGRLFL